MTRLAFPLLSFVVTCRGRLEHLQQTLPGMSSQPNAECIVVDYDCPDGTAVWVKENFPSVKVIKVEQAARFHLSRSRNLGAKAATGEWLVFLDADVFIDPGFSAHLRDIVRYGHYFRPLPLTRETSGSFVCHRGDFFAIDGYDEILEGYGGEDNDLYFRLNHFGRRGASLDGRLLRSVPHDDKMRCAHYEIADIELSRRVNSFYNHIKYDLMRESGLSVLPVDTRRTVYSEVTRTLVENWRRGGLSDRITITLPIRHVIPVPEGWVIKRSWTYEIERVAGSDLKTS